MVLLTADAVVVRAEETVSRQSGCLPGLLHP